MKTWITFSLFVLAASACAQASPSPDTPDGTGTGTGTGTTPPPAPPNSCIEKLIYSERQTNGQMSPPSGDSEAGYWKWERYEYQLAVNEAVACLQKCQTVATLPITVQTKVKKTTVTKSSSQSLKAGLIPLFLFLTGTNAEWTSSTSTTTEETTTLTAGGATISSGQRLTQYWATQVTRERETRLKDGDLGTRNRNTQYLCAVVGGLDFNPRTYTACTDTWTGPYCPPVEACAEEATND